MVKEMNRGASQRGDLSGREQRRAGMSVSHRIEQGAFSSAVRSGLSSVNHGQDVVRKEEILGVEFSWLDETGVIRHILQELSLGRGGWVVTPNTDILRRAVRDEAIRRLVASASLVIIDGAPVEWAARVAGRAGATRVPGATLFWSLSAAAAQHGHGVLLLGGRDDATARRAATVLQEASTGLAISTHSPPLGFENDANEWARIFDAVETSSARIIFCGLGFPKQEKLIAELARTFPDRWFLGVGISIEYASGRVPRAPDWMQAAGLEWTFRMATEPRRLGKRYLVDDVPFAAVLMMWAIRERRSTRRVA